MSNANLNQADLSGANLSNANLSGANLNQVDLTGANVSGVVINVSSINAHQPAPGAYSYNASKAAMDNLTVCLAREYAPHGVRVVGVAPCPVPPPFWLGPAGVAAQISALGGGTPQEVIAETEREIPPGRFATPEEVASVIAFAASPRAGSITGTTLRIDGGLTPTL